MSPFQIWVRDNFCNDFREDFKVYLIEPQFLRSAPQMCPIDDGNLVDVKLFIASDQECFRLCERAPDCSFFRYELHNVDRNYLLVDETITS